MAVSLAALGFYYARDGQWTVYKHNPDWASLAVHLRQQGRANGAPHAVFVTVEPLELFYYLPGSREVERPRRSTLLPADLSDQNAPAIAIEATDRTQPCEVAVSSSLQRFYLLDNRYWTQEFDTVLETLQRDSRCQTAEVTSFKGLDLYAVRVLPAP